MSRCKKIRYRDEVGAKFALAKIAAGNNKLERRHEQSHYRCPYCKGWHLTSEEQRNRPAVATKRSTTAQDGQSGARTPPNGPSANGGDE